jgi:hypothetical protein
MRRYRPEAFSKISPTNGATGLLPALKLTWGSSNYATSYQYCVDTNNIGDCDTSWVNADANTSVVASGLDYDTDYYWQVKALNAVDETPASGGWWHFTTILENDVNWVYLPLIKR